MKNHTAITNFILLGLTDDPQLQILIFIFLFLTYTLSVIGTRECDYHQPHIGGLPSENSYVLFLQNFSFLEEASHPTAEDY